MPLRSYVFYAFFIVLFLIAGCANDDNDDSSPTQVNYNNLSGRLTNSVGEPLADVYIVAMERTTNEKFVSHSSIDGSFLLEIENGVYDIGFDLEGYVTRFIGPVEIDGNSEIFEELASTENLDAHLLRGTVSHINNQSVEGWTVSATSALVDTLETSSATGTILSDGTFELEIHGEMLLDLDFISNSDSIEFVDIGKLNKPCEVFFTLGSTPNSLRHQLSDESESESESDNYGATPQKTGTKSNHDIDTHYTNVPFSFYSNPITFFHSYSYIFQPGRAYVNGGNISFDMSDDFYPYSGTQSTVGCDLRVKDDGSWWYDYAVHIAVYAHQGIVYGPPDSFQYSYNYILGTSYEDFTYTFTDLTGDSYNVITGSTGWHKVSYNSDNPPICKIYNH